MNAPSATQLGPSKRLCRLLRSVSSQVCLHNFQRNHLRSSYSSQASLFAVFAHITGAGNEFAGRKLFACSARLGRQYPPTNPCAINDRASFLPVKLSFVDLVNILSLQCSMMNLSMFFECGPLLPYIHLTSTRHHSHNRCSQAFPVFSHSSASMYYTERKPGNKTWAGLGTRLPHPYNVMLQARLIKHLWWLPWYSGKKAALLVMYYRKSAVPTLIPSQKHQSNLHRQWWQETPTM